MEYSLKKTIHFDASQILFYPLIGIVLGIVFIKFSFSITMGFIFAIFLIWIVYNYPEKTLFILVPILPFWLEWEIKQLETIQIGHIEIIVFAVLAGFIIKSVLNKKVNLNRKIPLLLPFVIFIVINIIAFLLSPYHKFDITKIFWELYKYILSPLIYLVTFISIKNIKYLKYSLILLFITSIIVSILGIFQTITGENLNFFQTGISKSNMQILDEFYGLKRHFVPGTEIIRAHGTFLHSNALAGYLAMTTSIFLGFLIKYKKKLIRLLLSLGIGIQSFALLLTFSRGGWLSFLSASLTIFLIGLKKKLFLVLIISGIIISILILGLMPNYVLDRFGTISKSSDQIEVISRYERWGAFFETVKNNPLFGTGYPFAEEFFNFSMPYGATPHNNYLYIAIMIGIPGLLIFFYIYIQCLKKLFHTIRNVNVNQTFVAGCALGILGAFISFGIHSMVEAILDVEQIAILFWFLVAISMMLPNWNSENRNSILTTQQI